MPSLPVITQVTAVHSAMKDTLIPLVDNATLDTLTVMRDVDYATVTLTNLLLLALLPAAIVRLWEGRVNLKVRMLVFLTAIASDSL